MANSHHSDTDQGDVDKGEKRMKGRHKKKLKRELKAVQTTIEKQEARLSQLQSNAFQLANYYFVFQGVILTALCNRQTALKCSDRWFLATLSALAAALNLAALISIGHKDNRIVTQHAITWSRCNQLETESSNLEEPENQRQQFPSSGNLSGVSSRGSVDEANLDESGDEDNLPTDSSIHGIDYVDSSEIRKRQIYFGICILIFLAFAIIVFVGCLKILCRTHSTI